MLRGFLKETMEEPSARGYLNLFFFLIDVFLLLKFARLGFISLKKFRDAGFGLAVRRSQDPYVLSLVFIASIDLIRLKRRKTLTTRLRSVLLRSDGQWLLSPFLVNISLPMPLL